MKKLNPYQTLWLKTLHILFACAWVGGACSMVMLQSFKGGFSAEYQAGVAISLKIIDDYIVIIGANGALLTGLIYSLCTPWGFFRWHWITFKWILTVALIAFGTFFLGPWVNGMVDITRQLGVGAATNAAYLHNAEMSLLWGTAQFVITLSLIVVSVLKPWKVKK